MHHVSPFMDLIGQNAQHNSENNGPFVDLAECSSGRDEQADAYEHWHGVTRTSVGLHKTVFGNVLGINMVHPESPDEGWTHNRCLEVAPSVASPMQHAGYKIN